MELAFDIIQSQDLPIDTLPTFTFKKAGGTIGRSPNADWYIADSKRQLSNVHASISFEDDQFFLLPITVPMAPTSMVKKHH